MAVTSKSRTCKGRNDYRSIYKYMCSYRICNIVFTVLDLKIETGAIIVDPAETEKILKAFCSKSVGLHPKGILSLTQFFPVCIIITKVSA